MIYFLELGPSYYFMKVKTTSNGNKEVISVRTYMTKAFAVHSKYDNYLLQQLL